MRSIENCRTALLIGLIAVTAAPVLGSATWTVCPSGCNFTSIGAAIDNANPGDTIVVQVDGKHTEGAIQVDKDITIQGLGRTITKVQQASILRDADDPVFVVGSGARATIRDMTIRHGRDILGGCVNITDGELLLQSVIVTDCDGSDGGGIRNLGDLTLQGVDIVNSFADRGGGIVNLGFLDAENTKISFNTADETSGGLYNTGVALLYSTEISYNLAYGFGGGILNPPAGGSRLLLDGCLVEGNRVLADAGSVLVGGGVASNAPILEIYDTTFRGNRTEGVGGRGGGLWSFFNELVSMSGNTFEGNEAIEGGGLWTRVSMNMSNSTFSGNEARNDGGGIYVDSDADLRLANVTISDNTADSDGNGLGDGGGIFIAGDARARNSLIVGNHDLSHPSLDYAPNCRGTLASDGYLLLGDVGHDEGSATQACHVIGAGVGNTLGVEQALGPLSDNGGPTKTHALIPGSLAVDTGDPNGCTSYDGDPLDADQRGYMRPNRCDRGAFELGAFASDLIFLDGFESGSTSQWSGVLP